MFIELETLNARGLKIEHLLYCFIDVIQDISHV